MLSPLLLSKLLVIAWNVEAEACLAAVGDFCSVGGGDGVGSFKDSAGNKGSVPIVLFKLRSAIFEDGGSTKAAGTTGIGRIILFRFGDWTFFMAPNVAIAVTVAVAAVPVIGPKCME